VFIFSTVHLEDSILVHVNCSQVEGVSGFLIMNFMVSDADQCFCRFKLFFRTGVTLKLISESYGTSLKVKLCFLVSSSPDISPLHTRYFIMYEDIGFQFIVSQDTVHD
jgi:hypothetical protein